MDEPVAGLDQGRYAAHELASAVLLGVQLVPRGGCVPGGDLVLAPPSASLHPVIWGQGLGFRIWM